ncbi:MAG: class I tRNA ligase family protein, partial [Patescibacteria group bacterium]
YKKRTSHGLILAEGGEKMSKSKGNVINPDDIVKTWGADSLRLYEMFMGPFEDAIAWNTDNMIGVRRFLEKVWRIGQKSEIRNPKSETNPKLENLLNKTIKKVSEDIESMSFNTAISSMMILVNKLEHTNQVSMGTFDTLLKLLAPFAPHMTEELWRQNYKSSIHLEKWPEYDENKIRETEVNIAIQINGKVRAVFKTEVGTGEEKIKKEALEMPEIKKWIEGKEIKKVVFVKDKILNLVMI